MSTSAPKRGLVRLDRDPYPRTRQSVPQPRARAGKHGSAWASCSRSSIARRRRSASSSLRRRRELALGVEVYEIKLGDEFLMSSLFTVAEIELARLGLAALAGTRLDVVVGGLGLGYTAQAVAGRAGASARWWWSRRSAAVIGWHERELLPVGAGLTVDPRSRLVHGDFFAMVDGGRDSTRSARAGASTPSCSTSTTHRAHCCIPATPPSTPPMACAVSPGHLQPGGVFALWSNDPPDDDFMTTLAEVFPTSAAHVVSFHNPLQDRDATNTVYVARLARTGE